MKLTKRKGFNFFRSYYDVYNELEPKDKVAFMDALLDMQFQGVKPKNLTGMAKFAYISQTNSIESQVKGYEDKTKTKLTPCVGGSVGGSVGGNTPLSQQVEVEVEEKVEEKVEVEVNKKKETVFNFRKSLLELGAKEDLVLDWLRVRKNKKATNTQTAFNSFKNQVEKSSYDINYILNECISNDWKGFKKEWLKPKTNNNNSTNGIVF